VEDDVPAAEEAAEAAEAVEAEAAGAAAAGAAEAEAAEAEATRDATPGAVSGSPEAGVNVSPLWYTSRI
jgi:hypothetical protein